MNNEKESYSLGIFDYIANVVPYLNEMGKGKVHPDNSVTFDMNDGGMIAPTESREDGSSKMILMLNGCSQEVRDKLLQLCDE